jgi:hypothetical protein
MHAAIPLPPIRENYNSMITQLPIVVVSVFQAGMELGKIIFRPGKEPVADKNIPDTAFSEVKMAYSRDNVMHGSVSGYSWSVFGEF